MFLMNVFEYNVHDKYSWFFEYIFIFCFMTIAIALVILMFILYRVIDYFSTNILFMFVFGYSFLIIPTVLIGGTFQAVYDKYAPYIEVEELDITVINYHINRDTDGNEYIMFDTKDGIGDNTTFYFDNENTSLKITEDLQKMNQMLNDNGEFKITASPSRVTELPVKYKDEEYINIYNLDGLEIK